MNSDEKLEILAKNLIDEYLRNNPTHATFMGLHDYDDQLGDLSAAQIEREKTREHPTDILDYFLPKEEILKQEGLMDALQTNYRDKHEAVNITAQRLTEKGCSFIAARNTHKW